MIPKNAQGPDTVQASSGSGKFLAGLGAMVAGGMAQSRRRVFEDEMLARRKDLATHNATLDIVKKAMGYDLEKQHAVDMIPVMDAGNYRKSGSLVRQSDASVNYGNPNAKGAGSQEGKPDSVDDPTPDSSTSEMKPPKIQKPAAAKQGTVKDVEAAVKAKKITQEEGTYISKNYAAKVGRKASAPKSEVGTASKPKPVGSKTVKPIKKAPAAKNGNSPAVNGNKKGGK